MQRVKNNEKGVFPVHEIPHWRECIVDTTLEIISVANIVK